MVQRKFIALLLLVLPICAMAQSLTGIWRGSFYSPADIMMGGSKYRYEVQINNQGREIKGVTYSYQTTRFYGKASFYGIMTPGSQKLELKENKMLDLKIEGGGDGCLMTCYLEYKKEGDKEYLVGTYISQNMNNDKVNCGGGRVTLERVPDSDFELEDFLLKQPAPGKAAIKPGQEAFLVKKTPPTKPQPTPAKPKVQAPPKTQQVPPNVVKIKPPAPKKPLNTPGAVVKKVPTPSTNKPGQKPEIAPTKPALKDTLVEKIAKSVEPPVKIVPKQIPPPAVIVNRENELFKTIHTTAREITISFYDNGEIDGDVISVYDNFRQVVANKGLSAKPITVTITFSEEETEHEIVMVAETLGVIPPNTALMIVQAGSERYTLSLSSNEQKNAMVKFKYDPK